MKHVFPRLARPDRAKRGMANGRPSRGSGAVAAGPDAQGGWVEGEGATGPAASAACSPSGGGGLASPCVPTSGSVVPRPSATRSAADGCFGAGSACSSRSSIPQRRPSVFRANTWMPVLVALNLRLSGSMAPLSRTAHSSMSPAVDPEVRNNDACRVRKRMDSEAAVASTARVSATGTTEIRRVKSSLVSRQSCGTKSKLFALGSARFASAQASSVADSGAASGCGPGAVDDAASLALVQGCNVGNGVPSSCCFDKLALASDPWPWHPAAEFEVGCPASGPGPFEAPTESSCKATACGPPGCVSATVILARSGVISVAGISLPPPKASACAIALPRSGHWPASVFFNVRTKVIFRTLRVLSSTLTSAWSRNAHHMAGV